MQRKLTMYEAPFTTRRPVEFFEALHEDERVLKEVARIIKSDLIRFLPPDAIAVIEQENFKRLITAVTDAFAQVRNYL